MNIAESGIKHNQNQTKYMIYKLKFQLVRLGIKVDSRVL
jgi:hypothetical protein